MSNRRREGQELIEQGRGRARVNAAGLRSTGDEMHC
jgi:hypothetical protein